MSIVPPSARFALAAMALAMAACGQGNSGDATNAAASPAPGPNSFLLFPNPQAQPDGSLQTNSLAYAQAYYAAIDPADAKDTLAKWKLANGMDSGTGTQVQVVFGDLRDLGYGRRMSARQNLDGTIAFVVENYLVSAAGNYGEPALNLEAAVVQDQRWRVGVNAIEYSPGPGGGASFAKFYSFNPVTGARELTADLDGRGQKALPSTCIVCHGGRGDALTPPDSSAKPLFPRLMNSVSLQRGDTKAHLVPLETDSFGFSASAGFRRADQESALKTMNRMVLCSYPLPAATAFPEDACRRAASPSEWQGSAAAALIKAAYGGDGLPDPTFSDTFVPAAWSAAGQDALYQGVIAPTCRGCHQLLGSGGQSDVDFTSFAKFQGYSDRIRAHVFDRGNMPLAELVYSRFWSANMPEMVAAFLQAQGLGARDAAGAVLRPGRPVAVTGPERTIRQGATAVSAAGSLFATSYAWSIVSGPNASVPPANATLSGANSLAPTFSATADGTYVLQLIVGNGATQSTPAFLTLEVDNLLAPAPAAIRFSDIKAILQASCAGCHTSGAGARPPVFFANIDRNGDGVAGDATDDLWFYTEVRGLINFTDIAASPLLRKPSGNHHFGGTVAGFNANLAPGQAGRASYDLFVNWTANGAPQ